MKPMASFEGESYLAAAGDADDASHSAPADVASVATAPIDAPTVSIIPAPEDLIFFADVGGLSSSGRGPIDEDDDVLLVSGTDNNWGDCDDFDDEASRASSSARSRWKSPRVGGLSIGKKNIGKKVSSLARGIAHRQPTTKGYDLRMGEENGKSKRRGSAATPRSKPRQKPKPPRIIIEALQEVNEQSAKDNPPPHTGKSPSAAATFLHLISPRTSTTVGVTAVESECEDASPANADGVSGMLDRATRGTILPFEEEDGEVTPTDEDEALLPLVNENKCDAVTTEDDNSDNDHADVNPYSFPDCTSPKTNLPQSSSPKTETDYGEPDPDQENIHSGNSNIKQNHALSKKTGSGSVANDLPLKAGTGKSPGRRNFQDTRARTRGTPPLSTDPSTDTKRTQKEKANEKEQVQENDVDTDSSPSSSSWRGKEILVRPRIIDLTPSMVSSDATTSTLAHLTATAQPSPGRHSADRLQRVGGEGEGSSKQQQEAADASFILHDIGAVACEGGAEGSKSKNAPLPLRDDDGVNNVKQRASQTTVGLSILTTAVTKTSAGQTTPKGSSPSKASAKNISAGQPSPRSSARPATPMAKKCFDDETGTASTVVSPAGSVHRQVLMEMISQDIALTTAGDYLPASPTSVRSEGQDDEEDSSKRQGSIFSFEDESVAMASYSSARAAVKELKAELLPSLADTYVSPRTARRIASPHRAGMRQQPSALRVRSPASSAFSPGTVQSGSSKKKVSFSDQSDVRYYGQREGNVLAASTEDEVPASPGGGRAADMPRQDVLFEQHEYDDADGSVFSAGDYYFYGGGSSSRHRHQPVAACGAATTTCGKDEVDQDDFSQVVMNVISDWREMMGRHEAVVDALKQVSGKRLECLQRSFHEGFHSGATAGGEEDPEEYYHYKGHRRKG